MLVKNNIARPGEIKSVDLQPTHIEVRKRSGEVMRYERKVEAKEMSSMHTERAVPGADEV